MADEKKDRYPPDQQFGKTAAEDQEKAEKGEPTAAERGETPRAGNKADPA